MIGFSLASIATGLTPFIAFSAPLLILARIITGIGEGELS
jgi:MFS family permease